jgi:hypothetical protein
LVYGPGGRDLSLDDGLLDIRGQIGQADHLGDVALCNVFLLSDLAGRFVRKSPPWVL